MRFNILFSAAAMSTRHSAPHREGYLRQYEACVPIAYEFDAARQLIRTIVCGRVTPTDVAEYFSQVKSEPWFPRPSLTDVREAWTDVSGAEVRAMADEFRRFGTMLQTVPIAVIVSSDVSYGLVRMIGSLLDGVAIIHPFRDVASALEWLSPYLRSESGDGE